MVNSNRSQNVSSGSGFIGLISSMLFILQFISVSADLSDIKRLRSDLLAGYDSNARPSIYHKNSTMIQINPYYRTFELDEKRSIMTLHCWTIFSWTDDHLKWELKAYGNLTKIHFATHEIWQPDLSVYNNLDQSQIDHFGNTRLIAFYTGKVVWVPPTKFQIACSTDVRRWPYDSQTCYIVIGSWAHDGGQLDLSIPANQTQMMNGEVVENREWEMVGNRIDVRRYYYGGIPYPDVLITINIRRRSGMHSAAVVVPAIAISTCILISFWLRPSSPERLPLLFLLIIINSLSLNNIYNTIPNNGDKIPLVLLFYRDSLLMVSVALLWTVLLRYLAAAKRTSPVPLPGFVTTFLQSVAGRVLCLDPRPRSDSTLDDEGKLVMVDNQADWAWLAHLLDRVAFLIYLIVYVCFYVALL